MAITKKQAIEYVKNCAYYIWRRVITIETVYIKYQPITLVYLAKKYKCDGYGNPLPERPEPPKQPPVEGGASEGPKPTGTDEATTVSSVDEESTEE